MLLALVGGGLLLWWPFGSRTGRADPEDRAQLTLGRSIYAANCGSCHGDRLQGQANWRERKPDGKLPAPPHDASGHTWHHPDNELFDIVKRGIGPHAPNGYKTDMPAFNRVLSDGEIWAVLAFIKSAWPPEIRERQSDINRRAKQ
jgi:mono/diheme cytochrome c family protein